MLSGKTSLLLFVNDVVFFLLYSCVVEDVEEAFVRTPDSRPLLVYLNTGEKKVECEGTSCLSSATRDLLEKVNNADKAAKVKVGHTSAQTKIPRYTLYSMLYLKMCNTLYPLVVQNPVATTT